MLRHISINVAQSPMEVTLVTPDGSESPLPGIVLCHHREGIDEFTLDAARRLSDASFVVAVPNFYHRRPREEGWQVSRKTMQDIETVADLKATVDFLSLLPEVRADRIGIVGHCMGGRTAFIGAATISTLKAAVVLYGGHIFKIEGQGSPAPIELVKNIRAPLLGLYGDQDHVIAMDEIKCLMAELASQNVEHEFHIYENAGHAFQDFSRPDMYRMATSEDAWMRTLKFLNKTL